MKNVLCHVQSSLCAKFPRHGHRQRIKYYDSNGYCFSLKDINMLLNKMEGKNINEDQKFYVGFNIIKFNKFFMKSIPNIV